MSKLGWTLLGVLRDVLIAMVGGFMGGFVGGIVAFFLANYTLFDMMVAYFPIRL